MAELMVTMLVQPLVSLVQQVDVVEVLLEVMEVQLGQDQRNFFPLGMLDELESISQVH